jgi:hypothetical protein
VKFYGTRGETKGSEERATTVENADGHDSKILIVGVLFEGTHEMTDVRHLGVHYLVDVCFKTTAGRDDDVLRISDFSFANCSDRCYMVAEGLMNLQLILFKNRDFNMCIFTSCYQ